MLASITEGRRYIRQLVFDNITAGDAFCFDLGNSVDAGPEQRGDLFQQNGDFFMVEMEVDDVRRAGPGTHTPVRVWGRVDLYFFTKDRSDTLSANDRLEEIASWYAGATRYGIRFREFLPSPEDRMLGFQMYSGTVPLEFETQPK